MTVAQWVDELNGEHAAEALSALCVFAKTKQGRAEIEQLLGTRAVLSLLSESEQPKVRKNLYRLIGALENAADVPILARALENEQTLFAVPSILLSLGKLGAKDVLETYRIPVSTSEETDKHVAEITLAYEKAMQRFETVDAAKIETLPHPYEIFCMAPHGFAKQLSEELNELGFSGTVRGDAVRIRTADVGRVYRANGMTEALLPIAFDVPMEPKTIAAAVKTCIGNSSALFCQCLKAALALYEKDACAFIDRLCELLENSVV